MIATGHSSQRRLRGRHRTAPRSIRHWFHAQASPDGQALVGQQPAPAWASAAPPPPGRRPGRCWCRRPPRRVRTRTPSPPGPCTGRCRAARAGRRGPREAAAARQLVGRSHAGCGPGAGTRAPAIRGRTSPSGAAAQASGVGNRSRNACQRGITRATCVCWSMTSLTRTAHGSRVPRQGRSRRRGDAPCEHSPVNDAHSALSCGRAASGGTVPAGAGCSPRRRWSADQFAGVVAGREAQLEVDLRLAAARLFLGEVAEPDRDDRVARSTRARRAARGTSSPPSRIGKKNWAKRYGATPSVARRASPRRSRSACAT